MQRRPNGCTASATCAFETALSTLLTSDSRGGHRWRPTSPPATPHARRSRYASRYRLASAPTDAHPIRHLGWSLSALALRRVLRSPQEPKEPAVRVARAEPLVPARIPPAAVRVIAVEVLGHQRGAVAGPLQRDRDAAPPRRTAGTPSHRRAAACCRARACCAGTSPSGSGPASCSAASRRPRTGGTSSPGAHPPHLRHVAEQVPRRVVGEDVDGWPARARGIPPAGVPQRWHSRCSRRPGRQPR